MLEPHLLLMPGSCRLQAGEIGYINDRIALHAVACADDDTEPQDGVTLHLYAPPITKAVVYDAELDQLTQRVPGCYSVKGKRV